MGNHTLIVEADSIKDVTKKSFGFWNPAQILLHERSIEGDYKELAEYLIKLNNVGATEEQTVAADQLSNIIMDEALSPEGQRAALQVWNDLRDVRALTNNVAIYIQGSAVDNSSSRWHLHGSAVERTVLCKYNGAATQIARNEDVVSWGEDSLSGDFVACSVKDDIEPVEFANGDVFAITGGARFFGKATVHRKPPSDGEPSLMLLAEPE